MLRLQLKLYSTSDYRPYAGVGYTALRQCRANCNQPTWKTCADCVGCSSLAMRMAQEYDGWAYITAPLSALAQLSLFTGTTVMSEFFLARDVIYTSRAYATMSVSVCLSVCDGSEFNWRIIANLDFKF